MDPKIVPRSTATSRARETLTLLRPTSADFNKNKSTNQPKLQRVQSSRGSSRSDELSKQPAGIKEKLLRSPVGRRKEVDMTSKIPTPMNMGLTNSLSGRDKKEDYLNESDEYQRLKTQHAESQTKLVTCSYLQELGKLTNDNVPVWEALEFLHPAIEDGSFTVPIFGDGLAVSKSVSGKPSAWIKFCQIVLKTHGNIIDDIIRGIGSKNEMLETNLAAKGEEWKRESDRLQSCFENLMRETQKKASLVLNKLSEMLHPTKAGLAHNCVFRQNELEANNLNTKVYDLEAKLKDIEHKYTQLLVDYQNNEEQILKKEQDLNEAAKQRDILQTRENELIDEIKKSKSNGSRIIELEKEIEEKIRENTYVTREQREIENKSQMILNIIRSRKSNGGFFQNKH